MVEKKHSNEIKYFKLKPFSVQCHRCLCVFDLKDFNATVLNDGSQFVGFKVKEKEDQNENP
jgi:hypothetical protein